MGPLQGLRILEFAGLGPTPFCGMLLSDMGADVVRIDRPDAVELGLERPVEMQITRRGRRSVILDLKTDAGVATALKLATAADGLIEGFRPGVMERLGLGPEACLEANRRLVYGRMTGWGQDGPLANAAGHDINYIALAGVLSCIGPADQAPTPPLNLVGDYGGGAMFLAFGMVCGLLESARSKMGQVVDAAMVDGAATLATGMFADLAGGIWQESREANIVDGGAPFYAAYETADSMQPTRPPMENLSQSRPLKNGSIASFYRNSVSLTQRCRTGLTALLGRPFAASLHVISEARPKLSGSRSCMVQMFVSLPC